MKNVGTTNSAQYISFEQVLKLFGNNIEMLSQESGFEATDIIESVLLQTSHLEQNGTTLYNLNGLKKLLS